MTSFVLKGSERPLPILQIVGGTSSELYFLRKFVKHVTHDFVYVSGKLVSGEFVHFYVLNNTLQKGVDREVLAFVQQSGLVTYIGELCGDSLLLQRETENSLVLYPYVYLSLISLVYSLMVSCYIKQVGAMIYVLNSKCQR